MFLCSPLSKWCSKSRGTRLIINSFPTVFPHQLYCRPNSPVPELASCFNTTWQELTLWPLALAMPLTNFPSISTEGLGQETPRPLQPQHVTLRQVAQDGAALWVVTTFSSHINFLATKAPGDLS